MSQFRPPSQPNWDQPDQNQQPFPLQQLPHTPPVQPQQYEQWQQQPPSQPLPMQSTGYYPWPPQADVPSQQQPQQPSYTQPGQYQQPQFFQQAQQVPPRQQPWQQLPVTPVPPQMPFPQPSFRPKRKMKKRWIVLAIGIAILVIAISVAAQGSATPSPSTHSSTPVAQTTSASDQSTPVDQSTPTPQPTTAPPTAIPTQSAAQQESAFKAGCKNYSVANLDKGGSSLQGTNVHFKAQISGFVKDSTGTAAGANVTDPSLAAFAAIQVEFTSGTDVTQINADDIIEVWGTDAGSFSGTNAYGGTVQEVAVQAFYLVDLTTGYRPSS